MAFGRPSGSNGLFQVWETLLQEVEVDSAAVCDVANSLSRQVSKQIFEGTYHRKVEARKIFQHRDSLDSTLEKSSQQLDKVIASSSLSFVRRLHARVLPRPVRRMIRKPDL